MYGTLDQEAIRVVENGSKTGSSNRTSRLRHSSNEFRRSISGTSQNMPGPPQRGLAFPRQHTVITLIYCVIKKSQGDVNLKVCFENNSVLQIDEKRLSGL